MEKTPLVISSPGFFSSKPNRNEFLKWINVSMNKMSATVITKAPAILRKGLSINKFVKNSGIIENGKSNAGREISNSHRNKIIRKNKYREIVVFFFFPALTCTPFFLSR